MKIDEEISRAERGDIDVLDSVASEIAISRCRAPLAELLADFREVEENFRQLDRRLRSTSVGWAGSKGELLDEVLGNRSNISESDQGRSFQAFYDFLLSLNPGGRSSAICWGGCSRSTQSMTMIP